MWIFLFLLITLGHGFEEGEDFETCINLYRACDANAGPPPRMPENAVELNRICTAVYGKFSCHQSVINSCPDALDYKVERLKENIHDLNVICNQDSRLHSAIVENLSCYKIVFSHNRTCIEAERKFFRSVHFDDNTSFMELNRHSCIGSGISVACIINFVEELCDDKALETVMEVMKETKPVGEHICEDEYLPEYIEYLGTLDMDEKLKSTLKIILELLL